MLHQGGVPICRLWSTPPPLNPQGRRANQDNTSIFVALRKSVLFKGSAAAYVNRRPCFYCHARGVAMGIELLSNHQRMERWVHQHSSERRHCDVREKRLFYLFVRPVIVRGWNARPRFLMECSVSFDWVSVVFWLSIGLHKVHIGEREF